MPGPPPVRTARIELRVPPDFLDRIEAWRISQPGPPSKTRAIQHLINLGLEAATHRRDYRPVGPRTPEAAQKLARRLRRQGKSLREISAKLAAQGFLAPSGKPYLAQSVKVMLG